MSHCLGQILDGFGTVLGHFEYNGTVDVARPKIFTSAEACSEAWRQDQPDPCTCAGIEVTLDTEGSAWPWDARACFEHGFIVEHLSPLNYEDEDVWPLSGKKRTP